MNLWSEPALDDANIPNFTHCTFKLYHIWFVRHMYLAILFQGHKTTSRLKFHFMVRIEALKKVPPMHLKLAAWETPGLCPFSVFTRPDHEWRASSFLKQQCRFWFLPLHFKSPLLRVFLSRSRFIHSVTYLVHSSLSWGGRWLDQREGRCVSESWVDVICQCEKMSLLLRMDVRNCLKDRNPALLFKCICILWRDCTVRKCNHSIKANAATLYVCVWVYDTGYWVNAETWLCITCVLRALMLCNSPYLNLPSLS